MLETIATWVFLGVAVVFLLAALGNLFGRS